MKLRTSPAATAKTTTTARSHVIDELGQLIRSGAGHAVLHFTAAASASGSTLSAGSSPPAEHSGTASRLIPWILPFWLAGPWLERQSSSFVCLRRAFGQGAVVPHPERKNGNDSTVSDVLHDDETAVVPFAVDQVKVPVGWGLPK